MDHWGMGENHIGQLLANLMHHSPVQIESSGLFIAASGYNTYYIKSNGSLWMRTGYNQHGNNFRDGTANASTYSIKSKPSGVKQVSAKASIRHFD